MSTDPRQAPERSVPSRRAWAWRLGVLIGSLFVVILPYWILHLSHRQDVAAPWWRVPVATPGVFDTYVYLNWIGAVVHGVPNGGSLTNGGLLRWYAYVLKGIWWIMSSWASFPEIWVATRWLSFALLAWLGAWGFRRWSGMDRATSRALICLYGVALAFSIGMRPGAYSWYLPFGLLACVAAGCVHNALQENRFGSAFLWSCISLFSGFLYPWHLMLVGIWLASLWGEYLIRTSSRVFYGMTLSITVMVAASSQALARWFLNPAQESFLGQYERSGFSFSRIPLFANTVIAFGAWIVLLMVLARASSALPVLQKRLTRDAWAWFTLTCVWFSTPFTGIHLYSDHLISVVIILSWLSLATVWVAVREMRALPHTPIQLAFLRALLLLIAVGACLFVLYIFQQPMRSDPHKFTSYVVHIIHWLALALAASASAIVLLTPKSCSEKKMLGVLTAACLIIAGWGCWSFVTYDQRYLPSATARLPVITWIRANIPSQDNICSDPESASFYGAHSGLKIFPAEATLSYTFRNEDILHLLETLAGAYNVSSSKNIRMYELFTNYFRPFSCATPDAHSYNTRWYNLLIKIGFDHTAANRFMGCRQEVIEANWKRISTAIDRHVLDEPAFRRACQWVIIPDDQKPYWQLPKGYREIRIGGVGIWSIPKEPALKNGLK